MFLKLVYVWRFEWQYRFTCRQGKNTNSTSYKYEYIGLVNIYNRDLKELKLFFGRIKTFYKFFYLLHYTLLKQKVCFSQVYIFVLCGNHCYSLYSHQDNRFYGWYSYNTIYGTYHVLWVYYFCYKLTWLASECW